MKIEHFLKKINRTIDVSKILNIDGRKLLISRMHRIQITYNEPEFDEKLRMGFGSSAVFVPCTSLNKVSLLTIYFNEQESMQKEMDEILIKMEIFKRENEMYQKHIEQKYKEQRDQLLIDAKKRIKQ